MEPVTQEPKLYHNTISEISVEGSLSWKHELYSLFVIPIFGIFLDVIIGLFRKYGCTLFVNVVRRTSNYVSGVNYQNDDNQIVHPLQ